MVIEKANHGIFWIPNYQDGLDLLQFQVFWQISKQTNNKVGTCLHTVTIHIHSYSRKFNVSFPQHISESLT